MYAHTHVCKYVGGRSYRLELVSSVTADSKIDSVNGAFVYIFESSCSAPIAFPGADNASTSFFFFFFLTW